MRHIIIEMDEEQYQKILISIKNRTEDNFINETFTGFELILNVIEGGISWLNFRMGVNLEIGNVNWKIN